MCIDQANKIEKSHPVPLMKLIHGSADRVLICIGEHGEVFELAMDAIADVDGEARSLAITRYYGIWVAVCRERTEPQLVHKSLGGAKDSTCSFGHRHLWID